MITAVMPTYARANLAFERGEGTRLFTADGEAYLDFGSGVAVNALGHAHPHLVETLKEQAGKLWHTSNLYRIEGQERLAERLIEVSFADTVFFANSGAEAMECAIKMVRKYHASNGAPERYRLITFANAFHGRTLATLAAGGNEKYLDGFGPVLDGFDQVPLGDLEAVKKAIGGNTAGILIEPIQGEGGIQETSPEFLRNLRKLCDDNGLLLVMDEVQTGMGRTGRLFAHEWAGITPDIMALAKALGSGFPVGACLATEKAASGMTAGTHGSTFGGNPLAMAVGNAVLDVMLEHGFLEQVRDKALLFKQKLASVVDQFPTLIEDVRGEGLLLGLKTKIPNTDLAAALLDQHLLTVNAGDNVVRFIPPLTVTPEEIDEAVNALSKACEQLADGEGDE